VLSGGSSNEVGIVVKPNSSTAEEAALKAVKALRDLNVVPIIEENTWKNYESLRKYPKFSIERSPPRKVIVVGGDGTFLWAVQRTPSSEVIFMTVRAGKRGFLLDVEPYEIEERVKDFVRGNYKIFEYPRLVTYVDDRRLPCALNDVVLLTKMGRLVRLMLYADGYKVYGIDGDGVVIATTLGSTGYSLSAGGPIVDPSLDVIVIAPLNPVQLHLRPVVLPPEYKIDIEVRPNSGDAYVIIDGQHIEEVGPGIMVSVRRCEFPARVARFKWWENYYEKLYTRLLTYW
jgi:NAD+ kinase